MIKTISILGGQGKNGQSESFGRLDLSMGQVVSIVGPTGSGKTTLINDIELFADADTPSGRRILIDGEPAPAGFPLQSREKSDRADYAAHHVPLRSAGARFLDDALADPRGQQPKPRNWRPKRSISPIS